MDKQQAFYWFCMGFAQSSEGYNAECAFPALAPSNPRRYGDGFNGRRSIVDQVPEELSTLFDEVWNRKETDHENR